MTSLGVVRYTSGPQTYTAVEAIARGQVVEGRDGGIPTGGSWGPVGVAGAGSDRAVGVALKRAAPDGTYDPTAQPLDVYNIVGAPPEVAVAVAPASVAVTFAAAASFGQRVMAAALGKVTPYAAAAGANEVQTITEGGSGLVSYTLTLNGDTSGDILAAATNTQVQTALEALDSIEVGDVTVTGSASGPYTVTFGGGYAGENVPQMTATPTGGTGTVTIATSTAGSTVATVVGICLEGNGVAAGDVGFIKLI